MTVYVIQCQQTFNVKIGYTARLVQNRLAELRTAASTPIELVKWYPRYSQEDEQALHGIFARYRVTGEWFKSDVLTLIDDEVQRMDGAKDYETYGQNGSAIAPAVMTVNVAVLKIGTQNMKQSFFEQLPVEKGFTCNAKFSSCENAKIPPDYKGIVWSSYYASHEPLEVLGCESKEDTTYDFLTNKSIKIEGKGFKVRKIKDGSQFFLPFDKVSGYVAPEVRADIILSPGRLWGIVDVPIKKYGNVTGQERYWLFENNGQLVRRSFFRLDDDLHRKLAPNYAEVRAMLDSAQQLFLV
jgi:hypothetical protein